MLFHKKNIPNKFSFDIKMLPSKSRPKYFSKNNNKHKKDIFIRKQDIYIIKLIEKRINQNKLYANINIKNPVLNPFNNTILSNYCYDKNIKMKYDKKYNKNYSYDKHNTIAITKFNKLIKNKIYSDDNSSKNNKNILQLITEINKQNNDINKFFFKNKINYNKTLYSSIFKLPLIGNNKNRIFINKRNIINDDSLNDKNNYNPIIMKSTDNNENIKNNNGNKIYYESVFDVRSISPIKSVK